MQDKCSCGFAETSEIIQVRHLHGILQSVLYQCRMESPFSTLTWSRHYWSRLYWRWFFVRWSYASDNNEPDEVEYSSVRYVVWIQSEVIFVVWQSHPVLYLLIINKIILCFVGKVYVFTENLGCVFYMQLKKYIYISIPKIRMRCTQYQLISFVEGLHRKLNQI